MFDYTNILNLHEFQIECSEGRYNIPIIKTEKFIPDKLIDFCHSLRSTQFSSGVHFFWMITVLNGFGVCRGVIYRI